MDNDSTPTSNHFLERQQPLHPNSTRLNDRLQSEHLNLAEDDHSCLASATRLVARCVASISTPRAVLGTLRLLKAVTFCFLILTIMADGMYIIFLEVAASSEVQKLAGGTRDLIIRVYGLILAAMAICIEIGVTKAVKKFSLLKGFIPRSMLLFFIAVITGSTPIHPNKFYKNYYADDDITAEIPTSAVGFQIVTSIVLGLCAISYFVCGLLCLDRFTSKAFISATDPRVTTAIGDPPAEHKLNP